MKIAIILFFLTYFSSAFSAYVLERIKGIDGYVDTLEFDYDGNAYVFSQMFMARFFKLNTTKDILWEIDGDVFIEGIHITTQNEVYLDLGYLYYGYVNILREDTLTYEEIAEFSFPLNNFLDDEDNLYFNSNDGMYILKPNSTTAILIKNLEDYNLYYGHDNIGIDKLGNIYLAVDGQDNKSIAVITKEAKQQEIPSAELFHLPSINWVEYLTVDDSNNAWIFDTNYTYSYIKKISDNNLENVRTDEYYRIQFVEAAKDRVYVEAISKVNGTAFFITGDGTVHKIPELENVPSSLFSFGTRVSDKEGNIYFGFHHPWDKGQILIVRPDANNTWIQFPEGVVVKILVLDENEDLWIGSAEEELYVLRKGETIPVQVYVTPLVGQSFREIRVNKKTNEIFVLTSLDGLYYVKNDSD